MRGPHLLRVAAEPAAFAPLLAALAAAGLRAGWLELGPPGALGALGALPASLEAAATLGVARAVAAGGGRSVAVKALRGAPVLRDLLREHFAGCAVVLVAVAVGADGGGAGAGVDAAGAVRAEALAGAAALAPEGVGWRLTRPAEGGDAAGSGGDAAAEHLDTERLMARLRRPHPWTR
jgi:hypothetical protein